MTVLTLHADATGQFEAVDPIASFGVTPSMHEHTFYGAKNITANTRPADLRGGPTSAKTAGDTGAMWVPTLIVDGKPIHSTKLHCGEYWLAPAKYPVEAPPAGMTYIAGNSHAMGADDLVPGAVRWHARNGEKFDSPQDVTGQNKGPLKYEVFFPDAWDGTPADVNGVIAPEHFAYSINDVLPAGFTHRIAQLGLQIDLLDANLQPLYNPFDKDGNVRISFTCGPWYCAHADFFNSWNQPALEALVAGCLNKTQACPPHS